ncbi:Aldehyde/histidinol dehydrogenase [Lipomyces tetrasporus]
MGNVVVWKPSPYNVYASYLVHKVLLEAGLPSNRLFSITVAALHFTGSSDVFRSLAGHIGRGIANRHYREYPRLVGETSGKNFHLVHPSADIDSAVNHTIREAFEYQGQKCSATSRLYIPVSKSEEFLGKLKASVEKATVGEPEKLNSFMGPVIHQASFDKIKSIIDKSNNDPSLELLTGGTYDNRTGYFVQRTIYVASNQDHVLFNQEIFGPVLTVYVYPDNEWSPLLKDIDRAGGGFASTGAVFASERAAIREADSALRYSADCKTTGAVIGQQSFGGGRASGTNDKAGSSNLLLRFTSPRTVKEEFIPLDDFRYPGNF